MSLQCWQRSCPVATLPIEYNAQGIVRSLTENNLRRVLASRGIEEDEQLYLVHVLGIAGISLPNTLAIKKFQNVNPALLVDDNVKNCCKSEMILLASICHANIIKILDVIERDEAIMLVYKYEVNGSLHYWLHQPMDASRPLSWPERSAIAIGVAKGLCHLHHGCNKPIVHHNISSNKISLDQNFKAVIASFGAAQMNMAGLNQLLPITDLPPGNFGYSAPEYGIATNLLMEKVDSYSFGVVLLELVTGKVANGAGADGLLAVWARDNCNELMANHLKMFKIAVDKAIPDQAQYMEEMATVFRLGVDCTVGDQKQRPSMQMALKRLHRSRGRGPFRGLLILYITSEDLVQVKGKVACEISSADELTLTELMFSGTLKDATVDQDGGFAFVFCLTRKLQDAQKPREELALLFYQWQETAQSVANLQHECKAPIYYSLRPGILVALAVLQQSPWSFWDTTRSPSSLSVADTAVARWLSPPPLCSGSPPPHPVLGRCLRALLHVAAAALCSGSPPPCYASGIHRRALCSISPPKRLSFRSNKPTSHRIRRQRGCICRRRGRTRRIPTTLLLKAPLCELK